MRLPRLTRRKLIVAGILVVGVAFIPGGVIFSHARTRLRAISIYERLTPEMTLAEVSALMKDEGIVEIPATFKMYGGPSGHWALDYQYQFIVVFDGNDHMIRKELGEYGREKVPRPLISIAEKVGIHLGHVSLKWAAPP